MRHHIAAGWMIAGVGSLSAAAVPAAATEAEQSSATAMLECAAFYDAAAAEIKRRPDLAGTRLLAGNPGRASMLLFSGGTQVYGVQASWEKYSALQNYMRTMLNQNAPQFARLVAKYDATCVAVVERTQRASAAELASVSAP